MILVNKSSKNSLYFRNGNHFQGGEDSACTHRMYLSMIACPKRDWLVSFCHKWLCYRRATGGTILLDLLYTFSVVRTFIPLCSLFNILSHIIFSHIFNKSGLFKMQLHVNTIIRQYIFYDSLLALFQGMATYCFPVFQKFLFRSCTDRQNIYLTGKTDSI